MQLLATPTEVRAWRDAADRPLGFVPTMGALHDGHLALCRRARDECAAVLVSIFVNPKQFGPSEDLDRYPRDLDADSALLAGAGVDAVFAPGVETVYPPGFSTAVEVTGPLTGVLEGAARPGHFAGVTTVVTKLLNVAGADRAYFGRKDAQQLLVVKQMVRDLDIPTEIIPCPTVREDDGLAMSSRNAYLRPDERAAAATIPRALRHGAALYDDGQRDAQTIRAAVAAVLAEAPLLKPAYISCARLDTLAEFDQIDAPALLSLAVHVGATRLIDNVWLGDTADA